MLNQSHLGACKHGYLSYCVFKAVKDHFDELEVCKAGCRVPCRFWQYGIRMSHMKLGDHVQQLQQQCNKNSATGHMCLSETIVVDIGYQTLFFTD
uniref:Uncharacterized protein n=1 Tax=Romanomermis culicivorax TaxID=13658 RepID=A0A915I251_ROMCU